MLGKGLESLIPSGGYKKPDEPREPENQNRPPEQPVQRDPSYFNYTEPGEIKFYPNVNEAIQARESSPEPAYHPDSYNQNSPQREHYSPNIQPAYQPPVQPPVNPNLNNSFPPARPPINNPEPYQANVFNEPPAIQPELTPYYPPQNPNSMNQSLPTNPPERDITPYDYSNKPYNSDDYSSRQDAVFQIEVDKIFPNPHQPRRYFDEGALNELANSIREFGIIQPLVVTKVVRETEVGTNVNYQLIAGERRLLAAKKLGLRTVPVIIKQLSMDRERLELAIIENIQRENLNPLEAARSYARLQDEFGLTQREIAIRMGKSRETIANSLRLLNLPSEVQKALEEGKINESHARLLLQITDQSRQKEMFDSIVNFKPSVRELKAKLKQENRSSSSANQAFVNPELISLQSRLEEILGTRVQINDEGEKGRITISYYSAEELNELIKKLSGGNTY